MTAHPNHVAGGSLTADEYETMFARNVERLLQRKADQQREAEWPLVVSDLLRGLVDKVRELEADVATLRAGRD